MRSALLALALVASACAGPPARADALKVGQLEQDLRELRRTVEAQGRRLQELEAAARTGGAPLRGGAAARADGARPAASAGAAAPWLQAANWERVQPGLGELDVIARLGPPTSMRTADDGGRRTLYYALEIGTAGYLAGHVVLEDRRVVEVQRPRLR